VPPTESQTVLHFPSARAELPPQKSDGQDSGGGVQLAVSAGEEQWSLIQCFQLHNIFILAPIKNGMLLIDQHAAHERVLFEQAMRNLQYSACESQQLLFPITIELSPTEKAIVDSGTRYFRSFGFELNDFGGSTVSVSAIPAFLKDSRVKEAIHEMLDYLVDGQALKEFPETHKRFAAGFACGSAIRAGQTLSAEEMNHLLNQLFATENPYICPHGRPTLIRLSLGELRRRFLR
jgi:DNA mismatch repair protein MutL